MKIFILFTLIVSAANASIKDEKDISVIRESISKTRNQIVETEVKKRGVLGALYEINKNLNKISSDVASLNQQLNASKVKIQVQSAIVAKFEKKRDLEKVQLAQRLRALYKIGFHGYAQMLLSSHTSQELSRNVKFMKIIAEKDVILLKNYKDSIIRIAGEQVKLRSQVKKFLVFQKSLEADKNRLAEQKQAQMALLNKIEKDKTTHMEALKEWREAGIKLEEQLKGIQENTVLSEIGKASFFERQGHFRVPVLRRIVQKYGIMVNTKFSTRIFHKGLFFATRPGDSVSAIYHGKVAFAGWVNGFGETMIIDHGDHYYSLYAHNSRLLKQKGETVGPGEIIAQSGDTGSLRGPGLYFEIRHFSESLDPLPWLDLKTLAKL